MKEALSIKNKVSGCKTAPIGSFDNFQGGLKKLDKKNLKRLKESIIKKGFTAPLFIWKGKILDGHQRKTAMESLKDDGYEIPDVPYVEIEAENEKDAKEILLTYVSQYADVTNSGLEAFIKEAGLNALELDAFTNLDLGTLIANDAKEDDYEPANVAPRAKLGDIYALGEHRVMCGSSTDKTNVDALMDGKKADMVFTDPPYGVDYTGGHFHSGDVNIKRPREKLAGDENVDLYLPTCEMITEFVDGPAYTFFAGSKPFGIFDAIRSVGGELHALLIWHKTNATYAAMNAQYKQRHEPFLYWKPKKSKTLRWKGESTEATIWEMKKDGKNNFHPTQKPVELAARAIQNHDASSVLDLFGGSGSTLIACEQTNRKCYMMELDPKYVDVIIDRWEKLTNKKAVKLN